MPGALVDWAAVACLHRVDSGAGLVPRTLVVQSRIAAVVAAQLFDFATFTIMVGRHGIGTELNPLVAHGFAGFGMPMVAVMKIVLVLLLGFFIIVVLDRPGPGRSTVAVDPARDRRHRGRRGAGRRAVQHDRHLAIAADPSGRRRSRDGDCCEGLDLHQGNPRPAESRHHQHGDGRRVRAPDVA